MNIRKLKGYIVFIMFSVILIFMSVYVKADTPPKKIGEGYTEDGVYYEIYEEDLQSDSYIASESISVTRQILYSAIITPAMEVEWTETISGMSYSGTLKLLKFTIDNNAQTTRAVYSGTLYATS